MQKRDKRTCVILNCNSVCSHCVQPHGKLASNNVSHVPPSPKSGLMY